MEIETATTPVTCVVYKKVNGTVSVLFTTGIDGHYTSAKNIAITRYITPYSASGFTSIRDNNRLCEKEIPFSPSSEDLQVRSLDRIFHNRGKPLV